MLHKIYTLFSIAKYSNKVQIGRNKLTYLTPNKKLVIGNTI